MNSALHPSLGFLPGVTFENAGRSLVIHTAVPVFPGINVKSHTAFVVYWKDSLLSHLRSLGLVEDEILDGAFSNGLVLIISPDRQRALREVQAWMPNWLSPDIEIALFDCEELVWRGVNSSQPFERWLAEKQHSHRERLMASGRWDAILVRAAAAIRNFRRTK